MLRIKADKQYQIPEQFLIIISNEVLPKSGIEVGSGNKVFGATILLKSNLEIIVVETNNEVESPLISGETNCLNEFFKKARKIETNQLIFLSTQEPFLMYFYAVVLAGFDKVYYFFTHENSRFDLKISHDLKIFKELFNIEPGENKKESAYLSCETII